ncbi:hypothetical protein [Allobranchiibius sp. GilTou38]|uniref:hypothetical protein n=1 Tax=Allobranchiibius sp. GilTou38 TaxID=2815210 RepID=UPI001AA0F902|nr:hypothetical protein [Allobranchiibius sp. GilTou38]MBO1766110.1 hypothetical protein [Allobranchiibius sp. GilTou38]
MATPQEPGSTSETVHTPGGPRPADDVHTVAPGEVVAADEGGRYRVAKRPPLTLRRTRALLATGDYAITPGGLRPKSMIHLVGPDEIVRPDSGRMKRFNTRTETFVEPPETTAEIAELPGLGSGWITYAAYTEASTNVIRSMTTTWTVPPEPIAEDGQLLYLFNGLQDSPVTQILQPVLQWGVSPAGGGNSWALASWLVVGTNAFRTQTLVTVQPGDVLTGVMKLVSRHTTFDFWTCEFVGFPDTVLSVNVTGQLVMPVQTLETYTVAQCRDYPPTLMTSMRDISVNTDTGALTTAFAAYDAITDCGQHTDVVSNTAGAGQIDLNYSRQFLSLAPAPVASISRTQDQIDLFAVGTDGSVDSTFWNPAGGWLRTWFRLADGRFGDDFTIAPGSPIGVLSRYPTHLDLFATGRDGHVYSTYWDASSGWSGQWFWLGDDNFADQFKIPVGSQISCVNRAPDLIDLFAVGLDGGVYSTFWNAGGGWNNHWFRLADGRFGDGFTVAPGTPVGVLSRYTEHLDLFATGRDGHVYSTYWDAGSGWSGQWFWLGDDNFADKFQIPVGAPVTALSRFRDQIDLFVSGLDGGVYSTFWNAGTGWNNHWFRLADARFGDGFTVPPGSPVTAISRFEGHIDLFVSGRDGHVYSTYWDASSGWSGQWFWLGDDRFGDKFTIPPGARVTAQSRDRDIIDLFVTGKDEHVYSTYWTAAGGWAGQWFSL